MTTTNSIADLSLFPKFAKKQLAALKARDFLKQAFAGCTDKEYRVVAGVSIDEYEAGLTTDQLVEAWGVIKEADKENRKGRFPSVVVPPKYFALWGG